ncbi:MAG: hypothetical protein AYK19_03200 [Theionarchaea archaeon DG-70-1]|nr:MAG: hypothetical protein AYK19_03200 [Theionarchaea archaeon DG-70-1]
MSVTLLGLDSLTVILVLVFSFIFDLIDLGYEEEIHSFNFVFSTVYLIYFIFRIFFGLTAAVILQATGITDDPLLLSIFSVIASASILQNFSLRIGGTHPINIYDLFQHYRDKMVVVVGQKEEKRLRKRKLRAERELAEMENEKLKQILTLVIADMGNEGEWKRLKQEYLEYADTISEGDEETRKLVLAKVIASLDPIYVDFILEKQRTRKRLGFDVG